MLLRIEGEGLRVGLTYRRSPINLAWKIRSPVSENSFELSVFSLVLILGSFPLEDYRFCMEDDFSINKD